MTYTVDPIAFVHATRTAPEDNLWGGAPPLTLDASTWRCAPSGSFRSTSFRVRVATLGKPPDVSAMSSA